MEAFKSSEEYLNELRARALCPKGFRFAASALEFFPLERPVAKALPMKISLILADEPTESFAALLTRNAFPGAPILLARERLKQKTIQGILINNKISNVGAPGGLDAARDLTARASTLMGIDAGQLLASSTGIIGWSLPVDAMAQAIPGLVERLGMDGPVEMAQAIMTTDRYPKLRTRKLGTGSIMGIAKGAGMIEPNLATMLVFLVTDIDLDRTQLERALRRAVSTSFNTISIDSDQSTSDMCVIMSSRKAQSVPEDEFVQALSGLCEELASDIVRNGEGTRHVIKVRVSGFGEHCSAVGKAVINSPLVKTAMYGNDPNVGRLVASIGDYLGNEGLALEMDALEIRLFGIPVFQSGAFRLDQEKEQIIAARLIEASQDPAKGAFPEHDRVVDIDIKHGTHPGSATVMGSDLGYEYIRENADYRS